jgi:hypothetical protein
MNDVAILKTEPQNKKESETLEKTQLTFSEWRTRLHGPECSR